MKTCSVNFKPLQKWKKVSFTKHRLLPNSQEWKFLIFEDEALCSTTWPSIAALSWHNFKPWKLKNPNQRKRLWSGLTLTEKSSFLRSWSILKDQSRIWTTRRQDGTMSLLISTKGPISTISRISWLTKCHQWRKTLSFSISSLTIAASELTNEDLWRVHRRHWTPISRAIQKQSNLRMNHFTSTVSSPFFSEVNT